MPLRVLIVEDCAADAELEADALGRAGVDCTCECVDTRDAFVAALDRTAWDLILADYTLPSFSGLEALRIVRERGLDTPTILVSGTVGEELAIEGLKAGATDYVLKARLARLGPVAMRALREVEERVQRALAEEALSESEAKLATVFHEALDAILLIDPHSGRILHANRAVERVLQYPPADLIGRSMAALRPVAPVTPHEPLLADIHVHGPVFAELDVCRADGSICVMDLTATLSAWGKQTVIIATLRDVTERRRADAELRMLSSAVEQSPSLVMVTDPAGAIQYVNPKFTAVTGYTLDEVRGQNPRILKSGDTPPDDYTALWTALSRGGEWRGQLRNRRRNGESYWAAAHLSCIRDAAGRVTHYLGVQEDITELHRAEEARQEELTISAALARIGRELILGLDDADPLDRLCRLTVEVLECDASFTFLRRPEDHRFTVVASHGARPGEHEIASALSIPPDAMGPLFARLELDDVTELGPVPAHLVSLADQEELRVPSQLGMALRRGTEIIGVQVAVSRDRPQPFSRQHWRIAHGLAQQASLVLAHARGVEELARVNRLKSEFVATMSHELRTPLNVILGYTDLLADGAFGPVNAEQQETLHRLYTNACVLRDLIHETLDLSRLEAGELRLDIQPVDLGDLLRNLSQDARPIGPLPGVVVTWDIPARLPTLQTDPAKLKLVIKNLVDNAMKFTETGTITISAAERDGGLEVTVADTGPGIAPTALPVIFEAFRQVDGSWTRRYGGVGLGLYIVRRMLDVLGGQVTVESVVDQGSTFRVSMPLGAPVAAHLAAAGS